MINRRILVFSFIMLLAVIVDAQEYRSRLSSPPNVYYKEMLKRSLTGEYDLVLGTLNEIEPVTDALQRKYGAKLRTEIRHAVSKNEQEEIIYLILKLIFWDMVDMLHIAGSAGDVSLPVLASTVRVAYLDYELLALVVAGRDRYVHERIKNDYEQAMGIFEDNTSGELSIEEKGKLRGIFRTIEGECLKIFPGFSLQYGTYGGSE